MPVRSAAKTPHILTGRKHHVIVAINVQRERQDQLAFFVLKDHHYLSPAANTCSSPGDLQPSETILMGETKCPYWDSSLTIF